MGEAVTEDTATGETMSCTSETRSQILSNKERYLNAREEELNKKEKRLNALELRLKKTATEQLSLIELREIRDDRKETR
jgi:hypothetical protein